MMGQCAITGVHTDEDGRTRLTISGPNDQAIEAFGQSLLDHISPGRFGLQPAEPGTGEESVTKETKKTKELIEQVKRQVAHVGYPIDRITYHVDLMQEGESMTTDVQALASKLERAQRGLNQLNRGGVWELSELGHNLVTLATVARIQQEIISHLFERSLTETPLAVDVTCHKPAALAEAENLAAVVTTFLEWLSQALPWIEIIHPQSMHPPKEELERFRKQMLAAVNRFAVANETED